MRIHGWQKSSFVDAPSKVVTTVFSGGCNMNCPYCHNKDLVKNHMKMDTIPTDEILKHLDKRKCMLDGICISGGEPTLDKNLENFIDKVREKGYHVKLDTNGYRPDVLEKLLKAGKLDYVAMDIKNSPGKYAETVGLKAIDINKIKKSVDLIKNSGIDHEFRTTVIKEFHSIEDIHKIKEWLGEGETYSLQQYNPNCDQIIGGFSAHEKETLNEFKETLETHYKKVNVKGL
ncbi:MAG: anaerobic ribonucleoside-triphosphate reductase activating protein [Clostridia bacterium]|jgi:pyruvate formate lyase activating enzyme|nr:anaerobic ribonucleoside-triphosphate reductase activating protein [Clostridia bacterium]